MLRRESSNIAMSANACASHPDYIIDNSSKQQLVMSQQLILSCNPADHYPSRIISAPRIREISTKEDMLQTAQMLSQRRIICTLENHIVQQRMEEK